MTTQEDAIHAYAAHCLETGEVWTEMAQQAWIDEWAALEAEYRQDAAEHYWAEQRRYFHGGV